MKLLKYLIIFLFFTNFSNVSFSKDPSALINEIVDEAASVLSSDDPVESKIIKLNSIAERSVDINVIGGDAWYNITVANDTQYFSEADYYASRLLSGVDFRAKNLESFESLENSSVDLYASVRSLYLQDRYRKIRNIDKTTDTLSDDDWEELDTQ